MADFPAGSEGMVYAFSCNRRDFLKLCGFLAVGSGFPMLIARACKPEGVGNEVTADMFIAGGGLGGCAAALAATRRGFRVVMAEPTDWIGGQATQQGVSALDDHPWIESFGRTRSYAEFRTRIRDYYRKHYPLTPETMACRYFNPGDCLVSKLCFEPKVALAVLQEMLAPAVRDGLLVLLPNTTPTKRRCGS
ncbi:MAG: FAD-dependent oxidoreductase [bacterium]